MLMAITIDKHGDLADPDRLEPRMLTEVFTGPLNCEITRDIEAATAAASWLLGREPTTGFNGFEFDVPETAGLFKGLTALPPAEAGARVTALYQAARKCRATTGLLTRSAR